MVRIDGRRGRWSVLALFGLAVVAGIATAAHAVRAKFSDWTSIQSTQHGFMIAYPASVFRVDETKSRDGAYVLVSHDGRARLLVATFENEDGASLEDYRQQLIEENYPDARLEFTPMKKRWFVLSGTQGEEHFYYRVSFTCSGRFINSWALLYPVAERALYDDVVEAVAKSYTPGSGRTGQCD